MIASISSGPSPSFHIRLQHQATTFTNYLGIFHHLVFEIVRPSMMAEGNDTILVGQDPHN